MFEVELFWDGLAIWASATTRSLPRRDVGRGLATARWLPPEGDIDRILIFDYSTRDLYFVIDRILFATRNIVGPPIRTSTSLAVGASVPARRRAEESI